MKIGITGANGFIGGLLVKKHLEAGDEVHILSRKKPNNDSSVTTHLGDLRDIESLKLFLNNVDLLYHCAAEIKDDSKMREINVEGTRNLIEAASNKIKHWVHLSSVGVYGPISSGTISEDHPYNPINEYERTKLEADLLVIEGAKKNNFSYTIIRPSIVFGEKMNNQSLFKLIEVINRGYYFFLGTKGASANYVSVENVIEALYLAGTNPKAINNTYIISDWTTIEDFITTISNTLSKKSPKLRLPSGPILFLAKITSFIPKNPLTTSRLNALTNRTVYSNEKIEKELGYKPKNSLQNGIENLVKYYKKNY